MVDFVETRFPTAISYGSAGGPEYKTELVIVQSGHEYRNQAWSAARRRYDVAYGIRTKADLETVKNVFEAMRGRLIGFRYKDWLDYKSCATGSTPAQTDQVLVASAAGGETTTQVIKTYTAGGQSTARDITKIVSGTLLVERNSVLQTVTTNYTINTNTGVITWVSPASLSPGDVIKAGYQFDVPVRFDTDAMSVVIADYELGSVSIPLVEVRV